MAEHQDLFSEFPAISTEEWEAAIEKSLKGKERSSINWKGELSLAPYYRKNNFHESPPGEFPYRRGIKQQSNEWFIDEIINVNKEAKANKEALKSLMNGATSITFQIEKEVDLTTLLKDIQPQYINLNFSGSVLDSELAEKLAELYLHSGVETNAVKGCFGINPITDLVSRLGQADYNQQIESCSKLASTINRSFPHYRCINIGGNVYANSGASVVQQLAYSIAEGVEYLDHFTERGFSVDDISARVQFSTAVGSSFFIELAKLRALRMLWANVVNAYKPEHNCSTACYIHAETSKVNKSKSDKHNNILRTTTEAMSAIFGGVDSLTVLPFDDGFGKPDDFSKRIARNVQNILKEESFLDKVADPAGGSYYVEKITEQLCDKAWNLFQEVEANGGIISMIKAGKIQESIHKIRQKTELEIANGSKPMVGVNKYQINKTEPVFTEKHINAPLNFERFSTIFEKEV